MITGNAIPPVIAAAHNENKNIRFKRQMPKKYKPLNELITVIYLGELKDNYEDNILHAIARLNLNISIDDIIIVRIPNNSMALIARSHSTNSIDINDNVVWVRFIISSQGMIGNSRFFDNSNIEQVDNNEITTQKNKKIQKPQKSPPKPPRNLNNLLLNTNLDELPDNLPETILNRFIELNVNINRNQISISNITTRSAIIIPNQNSRYIGNLEVFFTLNYKNKKI